MALISIATVACLCSGCASMISKSEYPSTIQSVPSGATVTVENRYGTPIHKDKTPTQVILAASDGYFRTARYRLRFEKPGYEPKDMRVHATFDGSYLGNICLGGFGLVGKAVIFFGQSGPPEPLSANANSYVLSKNVHLSYTAQLMFLQADDDTLPGKITGEKRLLDTLENTYSGSVLLSLQSKLKLGDRVHDD
jgi:hypothetical protein